MVDKGFIARINEPNGIQGYQKSAGYLARLSGTGQHGAPVSDLIQEAPVGVDAAQLKTALGAIQAEIQNVQRALQFSVDEESGATIIKVIDSQTSELIRQIPAEEVLTIASRLRAATGGLLLADTV